ncbi:MFS transporter [Acinetobacter baumannii]|uniref:MFS transporter n=1 Tax=Acinetobacter baumannii TaxID=470 RepID=UPI0013B85F66|nr:MFS transporter [Acinetobacter baumannii]NDX18452.1 MFS transporter [Acinetobacter baumannii]NDX37854.1 MFS transporter [Acinetobacter baumannii]
MDLKAQLSQKSMNTYQWCVVGLCILLNIVDGYDVMVMAFTSTSVSADWQLTASMLGILLSIGFIGMALGSFLIAPQADRIGRRNLILICLCICGTGMLLSTLTQNAYQLAACRLITGLGIGGILTNASVVANEFSSQRWKSLSVSLLSMGYAIGAVIGGMVASHLIGSHGWRSVFLFGGILTVSVFVICLVVLPESIEYLVVKQPKNALNKINQIAEKIGLSRLNEIPLISTNQQKTSVKKLFSDRLAVQTISIWVSFFTVMAGFYFILSWTPKILAMAGMSMEQGVNLGIFLNIGGILGAILMGSISSRFKIHKILALFMGITALSILLFVSFAQVYSYAVWIGVLVGMLANGCVAGLYALSTVTYSTEIRATGVGFAISLGRIGAILAPLGAGYFLDMGISPLHLYLFAALLFFVSFIMIIISYSNYKKLNHS